MPNLRTKFLTVPDNLAPGASPALPDGRISLTPEALLESAERGFTGGGVNRPVDALERGRHGLAVFPGREIEAVAQQVNDAGLHRRLGKNRSDRLGKAFEPVNDGDQHVSDAAVLQLVHDA